MVAAPFVIVFRNGASTIVPALLLTLTLALLHLKVNDFAVAMHGPNNTVAKPQS